MDASSGLLFALMLGCGLGVFICYTFSALQRARIRRVERVNPKPPKAVLEVFDQLQESAFLLNSALKVVYTNPIARTQVHNFEQEWLGDNEFLTHMRRVVDSGAPFLSISPEKHPSLRIRAFRIKKRFVGVLLDDVGAQQRLDQMRRDFIANMSHELKTPISAISLTAEAILQSGQQDEHVQDFARSLCRESQRLSELTRDIIHLSEAQSDILPHEREIIHLRQVVQEQIQQVQTLAKQHGVSIVCTDRSDPGREDVVWGRRNAVGIAVTNLLTNAIRHSPENGNIGVGMHTTDRAFEITVSDQGPGIPKELQARVFERFFRVDRARSRSAGGTGLGLSIVKHTMQSHGGSVSVWSQPDRGSSFTLHFPLHEIPLVEHR